VPDDEWTTDDHIEHLAGLRDAFERLPLRLLVMTLAIGRTYERFRPSVRRNEEIQQNVAVLEAVIRERRERRGHA
jgi:hypothetical protein